jgi:tripartite-type tricarboxylate transporter receptor subunit TctC
MDAMKRCLSAVMLSALACCAHTAVAQGYPSKAIRLIVPFPPGGGSDIIARVSAQKLSASIGQPVVVDNRPGAGGTVGVETGMKAPVDGYTLTLIAASYTVNPSLYKLSFDPVNDITPIIQLSQGPFLLAVHPSLPVKTVKELIALARARPGQLSYASSGTGSGVHLATELFLERAGIRILGVPYKGTGPALNDTVAGHVQMLWGSVASTLPQVKAGRLRGVAVSTAQRIRAAPEIPAVMESGFKDYDVVLWHGLIAPKGLPQPIVMRLNIDLNNALREKDMEDRLAVDGVAPAGGTPAQFLTEINKGISMWSGVVRRLGLKTE